MNSPGEQGIYEELITGLYLNAFPTVAAFVSKMGGTYEQASDVFQEAIVVYYESVIVAGKTIETSEKAYLMGISKHLWYRENRRSVQNRVLTMLDQEIADEIRSSVPSTVKLLTFLEAAGEKCMEMLKAFYYDKLSLNSIADRFGFSSIRSATVQKYKCIEKVRAEVKERKLAYEDFTE